MNTAPVGMSNDSLEEIASEVQRNCCCELGATRTRAVGGEGNPRARVVFVGEAPGYYEDQAGRPFVGAAGQELGRMLAAAGIRREDVFITNIVKCRPPGNRDPKVEEIQACSGYLRRQIALINPRVIVTLGRHSMAALYPHKGSISTLHGRAATGPAGRVYVALYHPAAALHQPALRPVLEEDFRKLATVLAHALQPSPKPSTEQPLW